MSSGLLPVRFANLFRPRQARLGSEAMLGSRFACILLTPLTLEF
jgi:hypothetical protein